MTPVCPPVVCDALAATAQTAARDAALVTFGAFVGWVADGASWVLTQILVLLGDSTRIDLGAGWFTRHEHTMQQLGLLVVGPLLAAAVIGAVARQDLARLGRIVGVYLPVAALGSFVAVQVTQTALAVTDEMCRAVGGGIDGDAGAVLHRVLDGLASFRSPLATGGAMAGVASLLVICGVILVWLELVARSAAVYVAAMFLPLLLAGLVWPASARWSRRGVELLSALILSKFVIVAVLGLGAGALGQAGAGLHDVLTGAVFLLLAAFAPFALLRLVPVVEAAAIGHLEGISRRPVAAVASTAALPSHPILQQLGRTGGPLPPVESTVIGGSGGPSDAPGLVRVHTGGAVGGAATATAVADHPGHGRAGERIPAAHDQRATSDGPLPDGWWLRDEGWPDGG